MKQSPWFQQVVEYVKAVDAVERISEDLVASAVLTSELVGDLVEEVLVV